MVERDNLSIVRRTTAPDEERSSEEIRQDIAAKRESITETVDRLSDRVQQTFDWHTYVAEYPIVAITAAAGLGYLLSRIFTPKPSPRDRIMEAIADSVDDFKDQFSDYLDVVPKKRGQAATTIKTAATALLTKAATDYVKNIVSESLTKPKIEENNGRTRTAHKTLL
jgi:ElaB/YqjD/DUF883 family membrane-anchored ribosome-binding protein